MSHANGAVRFDDGEIKYFEYSGTCDVCVPTLYNTYKKMQKNWRKWKWLRCSCGKDEHVEVFTDYGRGFYWDAKACRFCKCLTEYIDLSEFYDTRDGVPEWAKRLSFVKVVADFYDT